MKQTIKRLLVLLMCVALVIGVPASALAAGTGEEEPKPSVSNPTDGVIQEDGTTQAETNVSILVIGGVEIVGQTEDCYIVAGTPFELGVDVKAPFSVTYTWEVSSDGGKTWQVITDADNSGRYTIPDPQVNPEGKYQPYSYRVTVEDDRGSSDTTTINITVLEKGFSYRRILDEGDKVAVSAWMLDSTKLSSKALGESDPAYQKLYDNLTPGCLPVNPAVDLALTNKTVSEGYFVGKQTVEFLVGEEYNGQTLRVMQLLDGEIVSHTAKVVDGILTIEVDELSQFMVEAPSDKVKVMTITSGNGGFADPEGTFSVFNGTDQKIMVFPEQGYTVDRVLVDGKPVTLTGNSYTFTNIQKDHSFDVTFKKIENNGKEHTVIVDRSLHGRVSPYGTSKVDHGGTMVITMTPDPGYVVDRVMVNDVWYEPVGNHFTLSAVTEDTKVVVWFRKAAEEDKVPENCIISSSASEGGTISPIGDIEVGYGGGMYFYIIPDSGYVIDKVYVDGKETAVTDGSYRFINVVKNHTISATFKKGNAPAGKYYKVTGESGPHGTISPAGTVLVPDGKHQTFYFIPDEGYVLKAIYANGEYVPVRTLDYTLIYVREDTVIRVEFMKGSMINTGDVTDDGLAYIWGWVLLGVAGGVAVLMIVIIVLRKKKQEEEPEEPTNLNE